MLYHIYGFALNEDFHKKVGDVVRENPGLVKDWKMWDHNAEDQDYLLSDDINIIDKMIVECDIEKFRSDKMLNKDTIIPIINKIFPEVKCGTLFYDDNLAPYYGILLKIDRNDSIMDDEDMLKACQNVLYRRLDISQKQEGEHLAEKCTQFVKNKKPEILTVVKLDCWLY